MNNVLLEAASMARPLIATNVTGCRDIVEDGMNGLLCKVKDGKDLADKMGEDDAYPGFGKGHAGKKGREKMIREFDKKMVIQIYLQAIDEIANGKP